MENFGLLVSGESEKSTLNSTSKRPGWELTTKNMYNRY